jgi:hypothetical protein
MFCCFALLFIFLTNTFTKYKTQTFDNSLVYLFLLEVASIQLIEFFLWKNLKNKFMNELLSKISSFIIFSQQITLILMIPNLTIKYSMALFYIILLLIYFEYKIIYNPIIFRTSIGTNGHLSWEWMNYKGYENIFFFIFLLFYILPVLLIKKSLLAFFLILSLVASLFFYYKYNTFGTMWCWSSNIFLLYFIIDILIIKPYYEYNYLC